MLHIDHAGLEQLRSGIDAFGFGTLTATIWPDVLAGMRKEADLCREAIQVEQQSGLRYHAALAPLGRKATRLLGSQALSHVLARVFGGSFSLTEGRSCMTFYGEGDFLGPHQDQPAEECAVTIIVYLEVADAAIRHGQTGLELLVYGETMTPDAVPRLVIPTRAGAIVVGRGSAFYHERKRLARQERVVALTGCYRHSS